MNVWLDAHLSPAVAEWMTETFQVEAVAVRDLGLATASDTAIFNAARTQGAIVMTKDADMPRLLERHGPPPQIVWLTCGNTSNVRLREILAKAWPKVRELLEAGEPLIEIAGAHDI